MNQKSIPIDKQPASALGFWVQWKEEHESFFRDIRLSFYLFSRSPLSVTGMVLVGVFFLIAVIGPWIVPYPEDATGAVHMSQKLTSPGSQFWFGTDEMGRDVFTRVVLGTRVSLKIGLIIVCAAMGIGVPLGITAGFVGGWINEVIMRITDIFLAIPGLILALAIIGALGPGITNSMIALSLVWWPGYVRLVQGKTLSLKEESFIEAAQSVGAGKARIIFLHILPNCTSPIIVKASMDMGMAILAAAGLGFIGVGAQPPAPEWGAMISIARNYLPNGLRDILDPQSRGYYRE
jgi:peptide/nickel transport system permease protein